GAGIHLADAHGCAISANTFTIMKKHSVKIGGGSGRITVTGNNFSSSYQGEGKIRRKEGDRDAGGLLIDSAKHVTVTGNSFSGLTTEAITATGVVEGLQIESNIVVDSPTAVQKGKTQ
ncbi:MAG: right-handed parallel beta-helix repeat-containing protein, partial [Fuerstiella sp.]|nr:right-handed parallel beta-helix repeat-containing protein [Fuerstiella sp.]